MPKSGHVTINSSVGKIASRATPNDPAPFPEYQRVIYEKNPLEVVICQVRFPPVLKIDSELPAAFQEAVRADYPLFREASAVAPAADLPSEISKFLGAMLLSPGRAYGFASEDGAWEVTLTRESLALTCKKYSRWEEFRTHLELPLESLRKQYNPAFFARVGLRYRDVIRKSLLGLKDVAWGELLNSEIAGEFRSTVANFIENAAHQLILTLPREQARVTIQYGLAPVSEEVCYVFDSDFSTSERTEINDAVPILNNFNRQAGRLFRWCIAERLHNAMGPRPI